MLIFAEFAEYYPLLNYPAESENLQRSISAINVI